MFFLSFPIKFPIKSPHNMKIPVNIHFSSSILDNSCRLTSFLVLIRYSYDSDHRAIGFEAIAEPVIGQIHHLLCLA